MEKSEIKKLSNSMFDHMVVEDVSQIERRKSADLVKRQDWSVPQTQSHEHKKGPRSERAGCTS